MPQFKTPPSRLAELRSINGWSLRALSEQTGIDAGTLALYERRVREPLATNCLRLIRLFDGQLTLGDLVIPEALKRKLRRR